MANSDFGVPEFKAYNPNPYSGGYDLTLTYGKPLPPSHSTCYPPPFNNPHPSLNGFSYGSIPSPYVTSSSKLHLPTPKPQNKEKENKNQDHDGNQTGKLVDNISTNGYGNGHGSHDYSHQSWIDYGYVKNEDSCSQDDLGPCPSIFGYWPCLYKMNKKTYDQNNGDEQETDHRNQWEVTAEYLFGTTLYPYGESIQVDVSYGYNSSYRYQKHNIEEPTSIKQLKYNEKSPTPELGYYGTYQEDDCLPLGRQSNLAIVPITYGNDGHYEIQPPSVKVDYNEQSSLQRLCYGQSDHAEDYPLFDSVEYNGRSSFQSPGFDEAYDSQEFPALGYVSNESNLVTSYERHYPEQSHLLHVGYNEQCQVYHKEDALGYVSGESNLAMNNGYERHYSRLLHNEYNNERPTFQKLGHGEIHQEEEFPAYRYGEDFFSESMDRYNYYKQRSYYNE
ncbi:hypothetical protein C5167_035255 [Papaver somniferum]|uniref:Uncharacterized protein n=1 Tax=Papaver somniferum TaxID=3469 RepID=A0A4Y7KFA6_PAPSO|nr:uncharacterized protein At5g39570-like [Papaver somniferum]RZC72053.1 hypothetical protein C5167_035255 [Papaver somniferum]